MFLPLCHNNPNNNTKIDDKNNNNDINENNIDDVAVNTDGHDHNTDDSCSNEDDDNSTTTMVPKVDSKSNYAVVCHACFKFVI